MRYLKLATVPPLATLAICAPLPLSAHGPDQAEPVIYANTEEAYFAEEAGEPPVPQLMVKMHSGEATIIDAYGDQVAGAAAPDFTLTDDGSTMIVTLTDGETTLRRARPVTCWAAVRKSEDKPDGSPDYAFERELKMHDQGGRLRVGGGDSGAPETILRMRAVTWPDGSSNRPSLVLYVHTADEPDRAVSYSWADENASRVGLNVRWMQASCTIDGAERAGEVNKQNFRG